MIWLSESPLMLTADKPAHRLCPRMWQMREGLRTTSGREQDKLARQIAQHFQECSICYDWWMWMTGIEPKEVILDDKPVTWTDI